MSVPGSPPRNSTKAGVVLGVSNNERDAGFVFPTGLQMPASQMDSVKSHRYRDGFGPIGRGCFSCPVGVVGELDANNPGIAKRLAEARAARRAPFDVRRDLRQPAFQHAQPR